MVAAARLPLALGADGLSQRLQTGDALAVPQYTVATLPTLASTDRAIAYATNGRAITGVGVLGIGGILVQGAGAGTGCLVSWSGTAWQIVGTTTTVSA